MHQPRKWWVGLPVLAGVVYGATQWLTPQVEADLAARVAARLGVAPSAVSVSGRDVTLSGVAPDAASALRDAQGVRKLVFSGPAAPAPAPAASASASLAEAQKPVARPEPYVFAATLGDSVVALDGKLPDAALREKIVSLAAAAGAGRAVSDGAKIDAGAPAGDYAAALVVALEALAALERGKATLSDARLSIEGAGRMNVRADALASQVKARLPQGFDLVRIEVSPGPVSPYLFDAARKGGGVTLTGFAPDEMTRGRLAASARRRVGDATVEDRLEIAPGAPAKFTEAAVAALAALGRLDEGRLQIADSAVLLSGVARYEGARAAIAAALDERLPRGFTSDVRLVAQAAGAPLDAAGCRAALAGLSATPIAFDADDSAVSEESEALMDRLTAEVLRCKGVAIEVAGHWDDRDVEAARERSKRRAQRVVDAFVKAGADPFRVWAMGYGAERPIASNDTEDNRARNRRIEFNVK
ncbi:OmpA family protein [Methylocystis echinoides]|uniref:OmpA family protein n=1 Tax=Methylocystis echinoides TaxID=29468 RepID=UPI00341EA86F